MYLAFGPALSISAPSFWLHYSYSYGPYCTFTVSRKQIYHCTSNKSESFSNDTYDAHAGLALNFVKRLLHDIENIDVQLEEKVYQ